MSNEVEIPLKLSGVTNLKAELRSLKEAIADASDPEQMAALAQKAGDVADRIKDANEQVAVFTTGSKFEAVSNSFSMIGDDLRSLDFEGAAEKAATFSKTLGSLNAVDVSKGLKGLTSTVGTMSKAFLKFGIQLLTNPIFLLAVVIAAIVVAVGIFLNKIGVLEKVLYLAFLPLNLLIEGFQKLTDWLGLTSHAAEENARTMEKANEKAFKSSQKRTEKISDQYDIEIAKAKSSGKDTTKLEMEKSTAISNAAKKRLGDARSEFAQLKGLTDKDSIERRKALRKRIEEENKIIKDGSKERKLMAIQEAADQAAADKKAKEEAKAKNDEAAKKYQDGAKAIQAEINSANKLVLDSTKTQSQKEIDDIKTKYAALIAEAKKYKKDITGLEAAKNLEIDAINKATADAELARQQALSQKLVEFQNAELDREEAIQEAIYQAGLTARQKEIQERTYYYDNLIAEANRYGVDAKILQDNQRKELAEINKKFDDQDKAEIKQKALDTINNEKAIRDAKIEIASSVAQGLGAIGEAFIKDQKKLEKFNKAQALIQIGIDTAKAISSLVAMSSANPLNSVTGGAAGVAQYAAGIVQIVTNIAKAKALLTNPTSSPSPNGSGGGGGSESSSPSSSVTSFVPGNLFGQGNAANNVSQSQGVETNQTITVQAVVSETEMTGVQNKVSKIIQNSVL
jgi:hypothetical protein